MNVKKGPQPAQYVYRGVHGDHAKLADARAGIVTPGDPRGDFTPEEHNLLDLSLASPFTSWTHNLTVARRFAERFGKFGVVLRLPYTPADVGETWSWETSPDLHGEFEVLLRGVRMDAEVLYDTRPDGSAEKAARKSR